MTNNLTAIILDYNKGFKWITKGNIHIKGYFMGGGTIDSVNLCSFEEFVAFVEQLYGCFSIVIENDDSVWIAVDNARSLPLFYDAGGIIVSDKAENVAKYLGSKKIDIAQYGLMLASRNTAPGHTIYAGVNQLEAGTAAEIKKGRVSITRWYRHCGIKKASTHEELKEAFSYHSSKMIERILPSLVGKRVVLPLSGGYDSRFLACLLKENGYKDVVCYTYGIEESFEVQNSKKVAQELGYEWHFVEYNRSGWERFFDENNEGRKEYFDNTNNHCNLPHIQDYIALETLLEKKIIAPGDVVIPGFCGDVPAGSFSNVKAQLEYSNKTLIDYILSEQCINCELKKEVLNEIRNYFLEYFAENEINVRNRDEFIQAYEEWIILGRLSMWVVNSVKVYEHFGLEWRLPMWDKGYLNFWYSVPNELRENCRLYVDLLFEGMFSQFNVALKKPNTPKTHSTPLRSWIGTLARRMLVYLSVHLNKDYYKRNNLNDYNEAALILYSMIKSKAAFNYDSLSVHRMEEIWWCESMYGADLLLSTINN